MENNLFSIFFSFATYVNEQMEKKEHNKLGYIKHEAYFCSAGLPCVGMDGESGTVKGEAVLYKPGFY
jgi:hypothetical protein